MHHNHVSTPPTAPQKALRHPAGNGRHHSEHAASHPLERPPYRIWVAEMRKAFSDDWPYGLTLKVGLSSMDPEEHVAMLAKSQKPENLRVAKHIRRFREDLCPQEAYEQLADAQLGLHEFAKDLRESGHWVNGIGRVYHVYVIEMDDEVGTKTGVKSLPWLYVGETARSPQDRIEQHHLGSRNKRGPLYSRVAYKHFVRPRPDLFMDILPVFSRKASTNLETATAHYLEAQGYSVKFA
jgi:hypothetical protein